MFEEADACLGRRYWKAIQQGDPEVSLEAGYLLGDRCLGVAEFRRGWDRLAP